MNDSKDKSKRHFDLIATNYNTSHDGKFCADMYTPLIEAIHKVKGEKLLGCGNRNLLIQLVRNGFALTGVDLSEAMIEQARQRLDDYAELIVADAGAVQPVGSPRLCNTEHSQDREIYRFIYCKDKRKELKT